MPFNPTAATPSFMTALDFEQKLTPHNVLKSVFGFDAFRSGQEDIIASILDGTPTLAVMPTGAGKSLCYQVPALILDGLTIVISPLVALMDNQVAGLRANGVPVSCIHSGQDRTVNVEEWRRVARGENRLLYLSPERLMTPRMLAAIGDLKPSLFVIDEAHCVSKWGPAFRPEYGRLSELKTVFPSAMIAAFTATADAATREDIARTLFGRRGQIIVHGFDRPNLSLTVRAKTDRKLQLTKFMETVRDQSGIVYALSRKNTEEFAALLVKAGHKALPYHAGLPANVRFDTQERFMAEDAVVIVATIAFGMGIDKPDIRFVYHTNLPGSLEAYYQEIGRAGRDGSAAITSMCYGLDDVRMRRQFIASDGSAMDHQMRENARLNALLAYCEASTCRRQVMLEYFGERAAPCGNCDNCETPPELIDATEPLNLILNTVLETGSRFGQAHVIAVVRGAETDKIRQQNHDKLESYGKAKAIGTPFLQALIRQALASGHLDMDIERYGALLVTERGEAVRTGVSAFMCKSIRANTKATRQDRDRQKLARESHLSEQDTLLLVRLKSKRMDIAKALGKPAYIVFSDASLIDMAKKRPAHKDDMLAVSGVGAVKFQKFGKEFLKVIAET